MIPAKARDQKKRTIPPPGRKASFREALEETNKRFRKALAKLAK